MKVIHLNILGISGNDNIKCFFKKVLKIEGVIDIHLLEERLVIVVFDSKIINLNKIVSKIEEEGYAVINYKVI